MYIIFKRFSRALSLALYTVPLSVSLVGCGGGGDAKGRIVGTVYDGDPIQVSRVAAGTKVLVVRFEPSDTGVANIHDIASATADQNGRFVVSVPPGSYGVYADNGYGLFGGIGTSCTILESVDVTAGRDSTVNLGAKPCDGSFP